MASVQSPSDAVRRSPRAVRIAGVPWPLFKLAALGLGLLSVLVLLLFTGSPQVAVLAGAAVGVVCWIVGGYWSRTRR